jgi:hypothetical protein
MYQKVTGKHKRFLKYLWLLHTPNKLIQGHLLRRGSGSGPRSQDPDKMSESDRIRMRNSDYQNLSLQQNENIAFSKMSLKSRKATEPAISSYCTINNTSYLEKKVSPISSNYHSFHIAFNTLISFSAVNNNTEIR